MMGMWAALFHTLPLGRLDATLKLLRHEVRPTTTQSGIRNGRLVH